MVEPFTPKFMRIDAKLGIGIEYHAHVLPGAYYEYLQTLWGTGRVGEFLRGREAEMKVLNKVPNAGRMAFLRQWIGTATNSINGTCYIALGTGTSSPADTDVQLSSEGVRSLCTDSAEDVVNIKASFFVVFSPGVASGTWQEIGAFITGDDKVVSGTANSGVLFSRALLPIVVPALDVLAIEARLSLISLT